MVDETVELGIEDLTDAAEIGAGGFGTVYRARQESLRRQVAVKMVNNAIRDRKVQIRFEREIQAMGMLSGHPNIVTVYDSGYTGTGQPYILMAFMEKGSLADRLEEGGPLGYAEALELLIKVAGALETAHQAGILHRDIKPENVLVSAYGEPKLGDFGIARLKGGPETGTASLTASIEHVSPELLEAQPPSKASDVYALGSTMFKLLTGRAAFIRDDDESIVPALARIRAEAVPDLRAHGVPDPVAQLVERAMAKDPAQRFATAGELGQAAQDVQRQLGLPVTTLPVRSEDAAAVKEATRAIDSNELAEQVAAARSLAGVTGPQAAAGQPPAAATGQFAGAGSTQNYQAPASQPGYASAGYTQPGYQTGAGYAAPPQGGTAGFQQGYTAPPQPPPGGMSTGARIGIGVGVVVVLGLAGLGIGLAVTGGSDAPADDPTTEPPVTPTEPPEYEEFERVADDTQAIIVDVPEEWEDVDGGPWEIQGEEVGVQIRASTDLDAFASTWSVPGVIFGSSELLASTYDPAGLIEQLDFSSECTLDNSEDYSDPVYSGVRTDYRDCGATSASYTVIAAEPADQSAILLVQVQQVADRDADALDEIIRTFARVSDLEES